MSYEAGADAIRPVYLGAVQYEAGRSVKLEDVIEDPAMCARLRAPEHGSDRIPCWEGDILVLAERAVQRCLAACARSASQIDAVFLVSTGLDARENLDGAWLGTFSQGLELDKASHYQIGMTGCAGLHWAAKLAAGLIGAGQCENILIVSFDKADGALQRLYGEETDFPYVTGDAAAACLLSSLPALLDYRIVGRIANVWDGGQALRASLEEEAGCIARMLEDTCTSAGPSLTDIDLLVSNNYSFNVSRFYALLAGVDSSKVFTDTIGSHAHCFSSDNLINLHHARLAGRVGAGARLLLFSAGPYQWGACMLEVLN